VDESTDEISQWYEFLKDLSLWAIAYPFEFDQVFSSINEPLKNEARNAINKIMAKHYVEEINDTIIANGIEYTVLDRNDCITFKDYYGDEIAIAVIRVDKGGSLLRCHLNNSIIVLVLNNAPKVLDLAIKERDATSLQLH
jgi:hypothetical protein